MGTGEGKIWPIPEPFSYTPEHGEIVGGPFLTSTSTWTFTHHFQQGETNRVISDISLNLHSSLHHMVNGGGGGGGKFLDKFFNVHS